jgi:hypothetical protein
MVEKEAVDICLGPRKSYVSSPANKCLPVGN